MMPGISIARRDGALVGLCFLAGAVSLPWLPGPHVAASPVTVWSLAFLLPITALSACIGQSVFSGRPGPPDECAEASSRAVAAATTVLCSFVLGLQLLVLTTLTNAPFRAPSPARVVVILFGLHLAAVGNVLPRLRPGWPADTIAQGPRRTAWLRAYRVFGYVCVAAGTGIAATGATLGGHEIDAVLKAGLAGAAGCIAWSLHRVRMA